ARGNQLLLDRLASPSPEVRATAVMALADLGITDASKLVPKLLDDGDAQVRQAAAVAAAKLKVQPAIEPLLKRVKDIDPKVRAASLDALRLLNEPRVMPLAVTALQDVHTELAALRCLAQLGTADHAGPVTQLARRSTSADILREAAQALTLWKADAA